MGTKIKLPYIRFTRQVTTEDGANPQFVAMMHDALGALKTQQWIEALVPNSAVAMPINDPVSFTPEARFDAFKASVTTNASGKQKCNLGMAAYRYKVPADALANNYNIKQVSFTCGADKFAYSGIKVAAIVSQSAVPSTNWELLRNGGIGDTPDQTKAFATYSADPEEYGVLNTHDSDSVSKAENKVGTFTFDLGAVNSNYPYLYLIISMYDYTDYRETRQYWIEGSSIINGASVEVEFDTDNDITNDPADNWLAFSKTKILPNEKYEVLQNWSQLFVTRGDTYINVNMPQQEQYLQWSSALNNFCTENTVPEDNTSNVGHLPFGAGGYLDSEGISNIYSAVRFFTAPTISKPIASVIPDSLFAQPPAAIELRYSLYYLPNVRLRGNLAPIQEGVYKDIGFWEGTRTEIALGGQQYKSYCVYHGVLTDSIQMPATISIPALRLNTPSMFCLCLYVSNILDTLGVDGSQLYGSLFDISYLTLE